ncbi:MAG: hypothetical protein ABI221_02195 [Candidatus Saccharimonadales bacterium]
MSEVPLPLQLESIIMPGDVITLASLKDLVDFENVMASAINPFIDQTLWAGRVSIGELIRPKVKGHLFNGNITDITLTAMNEPYERLLDAAARGVKSSRQGGQLGEKNVLSNKYSVEHTQEYKGFILQANASSSGRGLIGRIQSELWYAPLSPRIRNAGTVVQQTYITKAGVEHIYRREFNEDYVWTINVDSYGRVIKRWVSRPEYDPDKFVELNETSRKIGLTVLQKALQYPIVAPMRD